MTPFQKRLIIGLIMLTLISPLGIVLPEIMKSTDAWGEWDIDTVKEMLGYIPEGMKRLSDIWKAPLSDYNMGGEDSTLTTRLISYIISGLIGILITGGMIYLISKLVMKKKEERFVIRR